MRACVQVDTDTMTERMYEYCNEFEGPKVQFLKSLI
jgi:hypothetical protein